MSKRTPDVDLSSVTRSQRRTRIRATQVRRKTARRRTPAVQAAADAAHATHEAPVAGSTTPAIPQLEVWERRLVDPNQRGDQSVHLKQAGFTIRIINTEVSGRYQEAVHRQGWVPIRKSDLSDPSELPGLLDTADGTVRTGPNGIYLWCMMPTSVYDGIARRKVEISQGKRRSATQQRDDLMNRAASQDPRGADAIAKQKGAITELLERVDMDPDDVTPHMPTVQDGDEGSRSELA